MTDSLADLLFDGSGAPPGDRTVVFDDRGETTRAELAAAAEDVAGALREAGVVPGQVVGVRLPDDATSVATLFGVWRAGAVHLPLSPRLTDTEVDRVLEVVRPVVLVDGQGIRPTGVADPVGHDDDIALIQMTSGTTGRPKPVLLGHAGVLELMDGVLRKLRGATGKEGSNRSAAASTPMPNLVPVSLSLWAGIYNVLFAFRVGASVVVMNGFATTTFAELVRRHQIRSTVLPPAAMTMLADDEAITDLAPLRFVRSITAPLSPLHARRFHAKFGVSVLNSYGQTEIGGEVVGWNAADSRTFGETKLGAVGRPHDGVDVRVDAETGELQLRTPVLAAGYADGDDLSDRLTPDGWFRTGDIGRIDEDGFVWLDGRLSDMINRGGLKVFPSEVEEVLRLSRDVADVAVVGVPDERLGQVPVAFVVARAEHDGPVSDLEALCREHLAPYKVPVRFEPVDSLPRNDVGKVLRRELVERAGAP